MAHVRHMVALGANINKPSADGTTALMWRTYHRDVMGVAMLMMDLGADEKLANREGLTAPAIAQQLHAGHSTSLRNQTMVKIFDAKAKGTSRDDVIKMAGLCLDARADRHADRKRAASALAPGKT